eukprot:gene12624-10049_t
MACTQRVREEVGRNASLLADGALAGMQLNALRPRGAALLGGRHVAHTGCGKELCPRCGEMMAGPHHPYTTCSHTSLERHSLLRDFAKQLTRLSRVHSAPGGGHGRQIDGTRRNRAHAPSPRDPRAADFYAGGGVRDPEKFLFPIWAQLCAGYLVNVTQEFWP